MVNHALTGHALFGLACSICLVRSALHNERQKHRSSLHSDLYAKSPHAHQRKRPWRMDKDTVTGKPENPRRSQRSLSPWQRRSKPYLSQRRRKRPAEQDLIFLILGHSSLTPILFHQFVCRTTRKNENVQSRKAVADQSRIFDCAASAWSGNGSCRAAHCNHRWRQIARSLGSYGALRPGRHCTHPEGLSLPAGRDKRPCAPRDSPLGVSPLSVPF